MKFLFKDILNEDMYNNIRVMFVLGKYSFFNNLVCDQFKYHCNTGDTGAIFVDNFDAVSNEFGIDTGSDIASTSVDFNTFMDVIGVPSINGKWYCKTSLESLTKKQIAVLQKYIKEPSDNGRLLIVSNDWSIYREWLKNRNLIHSNVAGYIQLSFPPKDILKKIVKQMFEERHIEIKSTAIDFFLTKMSSAYDDYEQVVKNICDEHKSKELLVSDLKIYMKGIENYVIEDFIYELVKPLSSAKTNNKKILRIMATLEDDMGAKNLVYQTLKIVNECIDFRIMINSGIIPIGIKYFFKDTIADISKIYGEKSKYATMNEWVFRKKAELASRTSITDWEYIKLMLLKALEVKEISDDEMDARCKRALYDICTRSVLTESRINNIIGIEDILPKELERIDNMQLGYKN